jgi:hypothetical protein
VIIAQALDTFNYYLGGPKHVPAARALERNKNSINSIVHCEIEPASTRTLREAIFFAVFSTYRKQQTGLLGLTPTWTLSKLFSDV